MPKTKMTRTTWGMVVLLMVAIGATAIHRSIASNQPQDHKHHQQAQNGKPNLSPPLVDGAVDPNAIPDIVAYEFLFNSIATSTSNTETERTRTRVFAERIGLDEAKTAIVIGKANSFRAGLAPLDAQAKALKDKNWPNPSALVKAHLTDLQARKERLLREHYLSLLDQLNDMDKGKLRIRIQEIKTKVKMYQPLSVEMFQKK